MNISLRVPKRIIWVIGWWLLAASCGFLTYSTFIENPEFLNMAGHEAIGQMQEYLKTEQTACTKAGGHWLQIAGATRVYEACTVEYDAHHEGFIPPVPNPSYPTIGRVGWLLIIGACATAFIGTLGLLPW